MNRDRILQLADHLDMVDIRQFNMRSWFAKPRENGMWAMRQLDVGHEALSANECGTTGCIAGHALVLSDWTTGELREFQGRGVDAGHLAGEWLGLERHEAHWLFMGEAMGEYLDCPADDVMDDSVDEPVDVEPYQAAKVLRMFADGEMTPPHPCIAWND